MGISSFLEHAEKKERHTIVSNRVPFRVFTFKKLSKEFDDTIQYYRQNYAHVNDAFDASDGAEFSLQRIQFERTQY